MGRIAKYSRRAFLIGSAAIAGGVAFGVYAAKKPVENPLEPGVGEVTLNPYLLIDGNGVTVITPRAEMGQGIQTTLAALVAEEMDLEMGAIRIHHGPPDKAYYNGVLGELALPFKAYALTGFQDRVKEAASALPKILGIQATGGSTSTIDAYEKMRLAGATARETLKLAAAALLGISADRLSSEAGAVIAPDGTRLPYTELAAAAAEIEPARDFALRPASDWKILGRDMARLDIPGKSTGTAQYGIDVRLAGMKFASVRRNPNRGEPMVGFDPEPALAMPGVEKVVDLGDGIAVVASNTWLAIQAVEAVDVDWGRRDIPHTSAGAFAEVARAFDDPPNSVLRDQGDPETAAGKLIQAEYRAPYLAHATMEPMSATALFSGDRLALWSGNQAPTVIRDKAAEATGLSPEDVTVITTLMGGGFGRRSESDFSVLAAKVAAAMPGTPVQLTWSREEDMRQDFYRPAAMARFSGRVQGGTVTALDGKISAPSVTRQSTKRIAGFALPGADKGHVEGAFDQPYAIANYRIAGHLADVDIPVGPWRSVGSSFNGFFHESFVDELAHAASADPLAFRLELMRDEHAPSAALLEKVRDMSGWSGQTPDGIGRGVALTYSFGTPVAEVIEVADSGEGIRVTKAWIACDVGTALDPRNIRAQMESGLIYGLSAAIHGEITFEDGMPVQENFPDYEVIRMNTVPVTEVAILEANSHMGGVGEPGTPPAIPALANAVFDLTGTRPRELPLARFFDFAL